MSTFITCDCGKSYGIYDDNRVEVTSEVKNGITLTREQAKDIALLFTHVAFKAEDCEYLEEETGMKASEISEILYRNMFQIQDFLEEELGYEENEIAELPLTEFSTYKGE